MNQQPLESQLTELYVNSIVETSRQWSNKYLESVGWKYLEQSQLGSPNDDAIKLIYNRINEIRIYLKSQLDKDFKLPEQPVTLFSNTKTLRTWLKKFIITNRIISDLDHAEANKQSFGFAHVFENPEIFAFQPITDLSSSMVYRKILYWASVSLIIESIGDTSRLFIMISEMKTVAIDDRIENESTTQNMFDGLFKDKSHAEAVKTILTEEGYIDNGVWKFVENKKKVIVNAFISLENLLHLGFLTEQGIVFVKEFGYQVGNGGRGKNNLISSRYIRENRDDKLVHKFKEVFSKILHSK